MKVKSVSAEERFDVTETLNRDQYTNVVYTCPACGLEINIEDRHFRRRVQLEWTNLAPEVAAEFDLYAQAHDSEVRRYNENLLDFVRYLDWSCPQCLLSVRVYFHWWGGGRHGESGTILLRVLEVPQQ